MPDLQHFAKIHCTYGSTLRSKALLSLSISSFLSFLSKITRLPQALRAVPSVFSLSLVLSCRTRSFSLSSFPRHTLPSHNSWSFKEEFRLRLRRRRHRVCRSPHLAPWRDGPSHSEGLLRKYTLADRSKSIAHMNANGSPEEVASNPESPNLDLFQGFKASWRVETVSMSKRTGGIMLL